MISGKTQKKQRGDLLMVPDLPPPLPVEIWNEKVIKSKLATFLGHITWPRNAAGYLLKTVAVTLPHLFLSPSLWVTPNVTITQLTCSKHLII